MNVEKFIKECESGYIYAKGAVEKMSQDDIVDMRAKLKQHIVNADKWSIVLSLIAIAIAMISLMISAGESNITISTGKSNITISTGKSNITYAFLWIFFIFLAVIAFVVVSHVVQMMKKSQYTKALSYLNDYEHIVTSNRKASNAKNTKRYIVDIQNIDESSL